MTVETHRYAAYDASEALRIGMANRVVKEGELLSATADLATRLASQPPLAIRGARRALDASWYSDPETSVKVAVDAQIGCLRSDDFKGALVAMNEGRTPEWHGR